MAVPEGTVQDVLDWVGDDPERAQEALDAEQAGAGRSTLIAKLEAIASPTMEDEMSAGANETLPVEGDEDALAPGPEQPVDIEIDLADPGTTISAPHVRDADVDADDVRAQVAELEDGEQLPAAGVQVESLQSAAATNGLALLINGELYLFNDQMTATLKMMADKAIAAVVL